MPKDLETIVLKCLSKHAADRYGTAEALSQDLRRVVRGDPIEARRAAGWERWARRLRRHPWRVASGALGVLLVVAAVALGALYVKSKRADELLRYRGTVTRAVLLMGRDDTTFLLGVPSAERARRSIEFFSGGKATSEQRIRDSLELLELAGRIAPDLPDHRYHAARGLIALGENERALETLDILLLGSPDFLPARSLRSTILRRLGDVERAQRETEAALRAAPRWARLWFRGQESMATENWEGAVESFVALEHEVPVLDELYLGASFELLLSRSLARFELKDYEGALRDSSRAWDRWPQALAPVVMIARTYRAQKKGDEMQRYLEEAWPALRSIPGAAFEIAACLSDALGEEFRFHWIDRMPPGLVRERMKAFQHYWNGSYDVALAGARTAVELDEEDSLSLAILALVALEVPGGEDEATRSAEQAERLVGKNPYTCWVLGHYHNNSGNRRRAIEFFRRAVELENDYVVPLTDLALSLFWAGEHEEAMRWIQRNIELEPHSSWPRSTLASFHIETGRFAAAREQLELAMEIEPEEYAPNHWLGRLEILCGNLEQAEIHLRRANAIRPREAYRLTRVLMDLGKWDAALETVCTMLRAPVKHESLASKHALLAELLRWKPRPSRLEPLVPLARELEGSVAAGERFPHVLESLGLALLHVPDGDANSVERSVSLCEEALAAGDTAARRASLATALAAGGRLEEAVLCLEARAVRGDVSDRFLPQLADYRERLRPRIASYASAEAFFDGTANEREVDARTARLVGALESFRAVARSARDTSVLRYLEGRVAELRERYELATCTYRELVREDRGALAVWTRWVEAAALCGRSHEVAAELWDGIADDPSLSAEAVALWWLVATRDLDRPGDWLSERLLALDRDRHDSTTASAAVGKFLEVLDRLARDGAVRINCGASGDREIEGTLWSRDRFARPGSRRGKRRRDEPLEARALATVLATYRVFDVDRSDRGYRIPLPSGRYRVTVHAAEPLFPGPGYRVFDLEIEKEARRSCDPGSASPDGSLRLEFPSVVVEDGFLDIAVFPVKGEPLLSAIEVEIVDAESP